MKSRMSRIALVATVGAAAFAALFHAPSSAIATEQVIANITVISTGPATATVSIMATPAAQGLPCQVTFTPIGGAAIPVGFTILQPGVNMVPVAAPAVPGEFGTTVDARITRYDIGDQ